MNNRYDNLMREFIELEKDYKKRIMELKSKIEKDKLQKIKEQVNNTEINIKFKTETKEFYYMNTKEKKRVHIYEDYFICKLWGCFRIFYKNKEVHSMKTTEKLIDAKQYVAYFVQQNEEKAV